VNIITLIQARTGSTRRPGKVLAEFPGGPLLIDAVYGRARQIGPRTVFTIPRDDTRLEIALMQRGWEYSKGPEEDVLQRFVSAIHEFDADVVVRVCGDCPFIDVEAARWTLDTHLAGDADLTTYHLADGRGVQVFKAQALKAVDVLTDTWRDSPDEYMLHNPGAFSVEYVKFSVDTPEELELARRRAEDGSQHDR
jgi:spore coat polysaccharide biosynthesis protein SpsF (cytidylyltransferase family)